VNTYHIYVQIKDAAKIDVENNLIMREAAIIYVVAAGTSSSIGPACCGMNNKPKHVRSMEPRQHLQVRSLQPLVPLPQ
jgi:hypothetical protein